MFPATSLPRRISNFGFRISDFVLSETSGDNREIRNSKSANPKLIWNSWQDSNPHLRRSKRRTLPIELQEREDCRFSISNCQLLLPKTNWKSAIGNRQCFQLAIGNDFGRGGQNRTVTTSAQDSDACITPHPELVKDEVGRMKDENEECRTLHPSSFRLHPFTQTTCLISATTLTRSFWFFITSSIDL